MSSLRDHSVCETCLVLLGQTAWCLLRTHWDVWSVRVFVSSVQRLIWSLDQWLMAVGLFQTTVWTFRITDLSATFLFINKTGKAQFKPTDRAVARTEVETFGSWLCVLKWHLDLTHNATVPIQTPVLQRILEYCTQVQLRIQYCYFTWSSVK